MDKKSNHAAELYEFHGDLLLFYDTLTVIADGLSYKFPDDPCGYSAITVSLDYYKDSLLNYLGVTIYKAKLFYFCINKKTNDFISIKFICMTKNQQILV